MRASVLLLLAAGCASASPSPRVTLVADRTIRARAARVDVHYVELGRSDTARTPLVFLHPWGADLDVWLDVAPALAADRRALLVDLPGHGGSGHPPGRYPLRRLAQAVIAAMDDARIDRAIVIGNSIGGATAITLAELAPARVAGLVLVGAPGGREIPAPLRAATVSAVHPRALATVSPAVLRVLWRGASGRDTPALERLTERAVARAQDPAWRHRAAAQASALEDVVSFAPELERLAAPTLVIQGEDDRVVWAGSGHALAARIEGARLVSLEDCGHFPQAECPDRFTPAVAAFVASLAAAP